MKNQAIKKRKSTPPGEENDKNPTLILGFHLISNGDTARAQP